MQLEHNGAVLHYEVLEQNTSLPWITLSTSLATDLSMWDDQLAALLPHFRILRYDMRGHGQSSAPKGPYSFELLTGDAIALWDALGIQRSHFIGLSIGGMIGQHLALRAPERLDRLVLCSTSSGYANNREAVAKLWEQRIAQMEAGGMAAMVEGSLGRWFTEAYRLEEAETMTRVAKMIEATSPVGYAACGRVVASMDTTAQLSRITTPTMVLVGEDDPGTPPAMAEIISTAIPGSRFEVLPQASHLLNIEQADLFNALLLAFLGAI
jgi:3-oxoadipate enol-lactonase